MKSLNSSPENCRRSGVIGLGLIPGHGPAVISLKVVHGHNQYEVAVPSNSSFGYLKSVISQSLGLKPETCKLLFGGIEKQDDESLQLAGLKDNSEVLLMESVCEQPVREEVQETPVASKGEEAVAEARKEIDKLEQQVSALQAVIDSGKKVDNKEIVYLTEMLMRQLLNLDGIEAEGEGRAQRKIEVRRVQNLVETLDTLKSRNSNSSSHTQRNVSVSSEWTAFEPSPSTAPPAVPSSTSTTPLPSPAPPVLPSSSSSSTPTTTPFIAAHPVMPSYPSPMPSPSPFPMPYVTPSNMPSSSFASVPHYPHSAQPSSNFPAAPFAAHSPMQYFTHPTMQSTPHHYQYYDPNQYYDPTQYYDPSQMTYFAPPAVPSSPAPAPYQIPPQVPSSNPFSMPSSTKVTENWEHFG